MKIGVIGGGSIGLLFTSYLSRDNHDVVLFVRREQQIDNIQKNGLTLNCSGRTFTSHPTVLLLADTDPDEFDVLIVAVKSYHLDTVLPEILSKFEKTRSILFIQNGMQHTELLPRLNRHSVYLGVVEHGALKESEDTVTHTGIGQTKIAPYLDGHSGINWGRLSMDTFPFIYHDDWYAMLSEKLHINSVINPLTAILKVSNGELITNTRWLKLMEKLSKEACKVLNIKDREAWEDLLTVCKNTSLNKSSMLRDIENEHKTEIDAINGFIINSAEQKGINVPNHHFVYQTIKGMEERIERRGRNG